MKPLLKARLERLGPIRDIEKSSSGSSGDVVLRALGALRNIRTIDAIHELVRCHLDAEDARKAIDALISTGEAIASIPCIDRSFAKNLKAAGLRVSRLKDLGQADVRQIRERMHLSARDFARRYRFNPRTVEGWEQGREIPYSANVVLHLIAANPEAIENLIETPIE